MTRILALLVCIVAAYTLPWFLTLVLVIVAEIYFSWFFEVLVIGIILDSLYLSPVAHVSLLFSFILLASLVSVEYIRTRVRV